MTTTISSRLVKGVTLSLQLEAAKRMNVEVSPSQRASNVDYLLPEHRPTIVLVDSGYWGFPSFSTTTHHYHGSERRKSDQETGEDRSNMAAIAGSILSVLGAGLVGYAYSVLSTQRESLHKLRDIRDSIYADKISNSEDSSGNPIAIPGQVLRDFTRLVNVQLQTDELNTRKVTNYFLVTLVMLAGGVSLAFGGFMMVPLLMTAGKITLLISAIGGALNFGLHFNDEAKISKNDKMILGEVSQVQHIQGLADRILMALQDSQRVAGSNSFIPYSSLVPGTYATNGDISPDCEQMDGLSTSHMQNKNRYLNTK